MVFGGCGGTRTIDIQVVGRLAETRHKKSKSKGNTDCDLNSYSCPSVYGDKAVPSTIPSITFRQANDKFSKKVSSNQYIIAEKRCIAREAFLQNDESIPWGTVVKSDVGKQKQKTNLKQNGC